MGCSSWFRVVFLGTLITLITTWVHAQMQTTQTASQSPAQIQSPALTATNGPAVTLQLPENTPFVVLKIPAGTFEMGSTASERGRSENEGPVHTVTIKRPFYLGKYEVTQQQWKAVMRVNPAHIQSANGYAEDLSKPVESISWNEVAGPRGFIEQLNQYLKASGQGRVRLPSEAEWEYASRAGTRTRFYFGDSLGGADEESDAPTGASQYPGGRADYMLFGNNAGISTHPVGQKRPNAWGLYDMAGNVQEWCQDWFHDSYKSAPTDGRAWENSPSDVKVVRGGAWDNVASICRSANRGSYFPDDKSDDVGFRLVWEP